MNTFYSVNVTTSRGCVVSRYFNTKDGAFVHANEYLGVCDKIKQKFLLFDIIAGLGCKGKIDVVVSVREHNLDKNTGEFYCSKIAKIHVIYNIKNYKVDSISVYDKNHDTEYPIDRLLENGVILDESWFVK